MNQILLIKINQGTLFSVGYSEKDIQDIQKNTQYQEIGGIFILPNTFSPKLDSEEKGS